MSDDYPDPETSPSTERTTRRKAGHPTVFIDRDHRQSWLTCLEIGVVADGLAAEQLDQLTGQVAWVLHHDDRRIAGFMVSSTGTIDPDDPDLNPLWAPDGPRFDAPALGLWNARAGEVMTVALAHFRETSTMNRLIAFTANRVREPQIAMFHWQRCLEAGDLTAHYPLGYTAFELGDFGRAYHHLRYYATIARHEAWVWCWLGRAALALGEVDEAVDALNHAIELEDHAGETDAASLLADHYADPDPEAGRLFDP